MSSTQLSTATAMGRQCSGAAAAVRDSRTATVTGSESEPVTLLPPSAQAAREPTKRAAR
jgi:hypothetical protein